MARGKAVRSELTPEVLKAEYLNFLAWDRETHHARSTLAPSHRPAPTPALAPAPAPAAAPAPTPAVVPAYSPPPAGEYAPPPAWSPVSAGDSPSLRTWTAPTKRRRTGGRY
ncbi:hypothetical protein I4F81_010716 [Pyropia yezoensis]|uniref:Uncharacterized protein n=1 Tax=Pyropia yezoensis TaxID=2788 RepID=A0ACC3CEL9_PYRYE|nr:hypothetical protein I4F81_010716 [Neopyropia yezoensis]